MQTFTSLRYCETGGWRLLGASDPPGHSRRVPEWRFHLSGCSQTGLNCATSHRTQGETLKPWSARDGGMAATYYISWWPWLTWCCDKNTGSSHFTTGWMMYCATSSLLSLSRHKRDRGLRVKVCPFYYVHALYSFLPFIYTLWETVRIK